MTNPADICVYGGAAGGGKTFGLLLESARNLNTPRYGATFLRRTFSEITEKGGAWDKSCELFYPLGGVPNYSEKKWYFEQGSTFNFKHLQHEKNLDSLGSSELPLILIDEATSFTERMFWALVARNRSDIQGFSPYMRLSCNPDPDHFLAEFLSWWIGEDGFPIAERSGVVRWFVRDGEQIVWFKELKEARNAYPEHDENILSVSFVPSKLSDNKILETKDPKYRARLEALPFVERMRKLGDEEKGGNWKVRQSAGMIRREWLIGNIRDHAPPGTQWVRYWDTAATGEKEPGSEKAAYTCGVLIGRDQWRRIWIGDVIRSRVSGRDRDTLIRGTADLDRQLYGSVPQWLEQEPGGGGKTDARANVALLIGHDVHIETVSKRGDKVLRFGPFARQAEGGNVFLVRGQWNIAYMNELEAFPMGKLKDQADATSGGFDKLIVPEITEYDYEPIDYPKGYVDAIDPAAFK